VEQGYIKPEQAETYQKMLTGLQKSYMERKTAEQRLAMEHDLQKAAISAQAQARVFAQQDKTVATRLESNAALLDKKLAADAAKAGEKQEEKEATLKDYEIKDLQQWNAAEQALSEVEKMLDDPRAEKIMGWTSGTAARLGAKYAPNQLDKDGFIAGFDAKLKLQTAQAIKSTGAGARGFGPQERPYFEGLAEGITRGKEQNKQIIDRWREYLDQGRRGLLTAHPDEILSKYPKLWGPRLYQTQPEAAPDIWTAEKVRALKEGK
jgi:hypothetical protein